MLIHLLLRRHRRIIPSTVTLNDAKEDVVRVSTEKKWRERKPATILWIRQKRRRRRRMSKNSRRRPAGG
jgi:hypothetical protein